MERRLSICETHFFNANSFFYNRDNRASATTKQILNQNQFGGVLGGPVIKNKLFAFFSYQGTRQKKRDWLAGFTTSPSAANSRWRPAGPGFPVCAGAAKLSDESSRPKLTQCVWWHERRL